MLDMPPWLVYAVIGVIFSMAEIFLPGFIALPIGVGFLLVVPVTLITDSTVVHLAALAIAQLAVFIFLRKYRPQLSKPARLSNVDGMIGKVCEVVEPVSSQNPGYVKLYGDRWQAITTSQKSFQIGERAVIVGIDGNKVLIEESTQEKGLK